jgi:hypothetical protein
MKRTIFLLTALLLLLVVTPVRSQSNLFVYKTNEKLTVPIDDLQKLTFSETALAVNKTNGEATPVSFADLYCISFTDNLYTYPATGISALEAAGAVSIWYDNDNESVRVKSAQAITDVNIFDLQGRKLVQLKPQSQEVNIPLAAHPTGIYLVRVADENGAITKKIVKN